MPNLQRLPANNADALHGSVGYGYMLRRVLWVGARMCLSAPVNESYGTIGKQGRTLLFAKGIKP